ncbi:enoyl-CoA hydratase [Salinisphaera sp. T31B1]|uniref:enoyl-CoA hydratase n=1 Tax=Salinisphaera sp. T31B1 TaxID=727963 RepID=UPI00333E4FDB
MSDSEPKIEKVGRVAVLTLDCPPANTFSVTALAGLDSQLARLEQDRSVDAIVMTGAGDAFFSAGDDLHMFVGADRAGARELGRLLAAAAARLARFRGLTVAAINGYCLGAGLEFALACDIRICEEHALLGLPEARVGLLPCGGGTQRLPWLVGEGWAKRMILCGEQVDAQTALRIRLVEEVVAKGQAYDTALGLADKLARQSPRAVAASKRLIDSARLQALETGHAREIEAFSTLFEGDDPKEGVAAFFDKREPVWK